MSYTEYLRRKAAAAPVVVDTRMKLDASSFTNRVRLAASADFSTNGQKYGSVTNVNDPDSGGTAGQFIHSVASYKKGSGGRVPDASSFTAFRGSQGLANQALVPTPVRRVKNSNDAGSISGCSPVLAPIPYVPGGVLLENLNTTLSYIDADNLNPGQGPLQLGGIHCYYNPVTFSTTIPTNGLVGGTTVTITGTPITLEVTRFEAMSANLQVVHITSLGPAGALQIGTTVTIANATDTANNGTFVVSATGGTVGDYTFTWANTLGVARLEAKTATNVTSSTTMSILRFEASSGGTQVVRVTALNGTFTPGITTITISNATDAANNRTTVTLTGTAGPFTSGNTTYYTFTWANTSGVARTESKTSTFPTPNQGTFKIFEVIPVSISPYGLPGFVFANPTAPGASFYTNSSPTTNTLSFSIYSSGAFAPNMVSVTGSQQARNVLACKELKGEPHSTNATTYPSPPMFVDNTISQVKNYNLSQNKTTYQRSTKCTACGGNPAGTGVTCTFCVGANHVPPADVPHNRRWGPRPVKAAQPILVAPSPSDARKVGAAMRNIPYVEKHHGNPMIGHIQYPETPYQIPAGTAAHLKINEPVHYPGTM